MAKSPKTQEMLTHGQIWTALDRLAERAGLSASGLAKKSGLDPTTFNKSKRVTGDGRERWPSTESVAKALAATNSSIESFVQLIGDTAHTTPSVPLLGFAQAASNGAFDERGLPAGKGWNATGLPAIDDAHAYALEISGDAMKPAYRDGDVIVVSPNTPIRRGDRALELQSLNAAQADRTLAAGDVQWIARVVWASQ
jgi:phage repressor protein C with HTH and peptisase S24 domain